MKKNNGFTLIELLAIIVILAIIAVITVPIILNIIENSKKGAAQDSAYGYKDAVEKYYVSELYDNSSFKLDGTYTISDGDFDGIEIPLSGTKPSGGSLTYEGNLLTGGCLVFGDYAVSFASDGSISSTERGECPESIDYAAIIDALDGHDEADNAKYLTTPVDIYYNPANPSDDCSSSDSVSTTGTKTGCMHWYLYSVKGNYANMILDHNINQSGEGVLWASKADYEAGQQPVPDTAFYTEGTKASSLGISFPDNTSFPAYGNWNSSKGPLTVLSYLNENTESAWNTRMPKVPNSNDTDEQIVVVDTPKSKYTINYSGYKARLITAQEIANIKGDSFNESSSYSSVSVVSYNWLYDHSSSDAGLYAYWTSSSFAGNFDYAWSLRYVGNMDYDYVSYPFIGVRPVVTVLIDDVLPELEEAIS